MTRIILIVFSAIAFGTYSIPFSKIAKWNLSLPLMLIGGTLFVMIYLSLFEKVKYTQACPYEAGVVIKWLVLAIVIYGIGFIAFGKLLSAPSHTVQVSVALCTALIPVFALVVDLIIKRQMISISQTAGLFLIVGGVVLLNQKS